MRGAAGLRHLGRGRAADRPHRNARFPRRWSGRQANVAVVGRALAPRQRGSAVLDTERCRLDTLPPDPNARTDA